MLKAFLFLRCRVVVHVVLKGAEDARRLHCSAPLRTKDALHHNASPHIEHLAIVADPVVVWDLVDSVAPLVHWNVASSTEDYEVLIFVIAIVANGTLGVLLHDQASLVGTQRVVPLDV